MFPVDTVKTRLHRLHPTAAATYNGTLDALVTIARTENPGTLFRGISVVASGAGPAHAIYFSSYEQAKKLLGITDTAHENHIGALCTRVQGHTHTSTHARARSNTRAHTRATHARTRTHTHT